MPLGARCVADASLLGPSVGLRPHDNFEAEAVEHLVPTVRQAPAVSREQCGDVLPREADVLRELRLADAVLQHVDANVEPDAIRHVCHVDMVRRSRL